MESSLVSVSFLQRLLADDSLSRRLLAGVILVEELLFMSSLVMGHSLTLCTPLHFGFRHGAFHFPSSFHSRFFLGFFFDGSCEGGGASAIFLGFQFLERPENPRFLPIRARAASPCATLTAVVPIR